MRISDWSSDVCSSDLAARMDAGGGDLHSAHAVHPVQMEIAAGPSEILLAALRPSASSRAGAPLQRCRWESLRLCASMTSPTMLAPGAAPRSSAIRSALCCASTARSEEHTSELQSLMRHSYA